MTIKNLIKWTAGGTAALLLALSAGTASAQCVSSEDGSGINSFPLIAGQNQVAGSVSVWVEGDYLKVAYSTSGWDINAIHLWVGSDLAALPQNKQGNPTLGKFPYHSGPVSSGYTFSIPLAGLGFSCASGDLLLHMAAYADVSNASGSEGAWSDGLAIVAQGNWATYSSFTLTCDCAQPETTCETAFAVGTGSECFLDSGFSRWGWTTWLENAGEYTFDLYAAAGQCDTSKGTLVGTVDVNYADGVATVSIGTFPGFSLSETHVYVGDTKFPSKNGEWTVAPGQYPQIHENLGGVKTDSFEFTGLSGSVYVIVHAVVCGFYQ